MTPKLSIVIPVLNESQGILTTLAALQDLRGRGAEIVVADGGSRDDTARMARDSGLADRVLDAPRGRALQMNAGAAAATGETLLFLHADTRLPPDADLLIRDALAGREGWGRFDVRIEGRHRMFAVIAACMNLRSRITGIATGDQCIFATRALFERCGRFPDQPLMEDIALSGALGKLVPPRCLRQKCVTSGRRWEQKGLWRTILLMWRLRLEYFLGASPRELARRYEREARKG